MSEQSLKNKTVKGVGWQAIDKVANYGISFIVGIILARLLSPDEYGLLGIIGIFIAVFNIILDSGLSTALIRKQDATEEDYCTVFHTNLILSFFLTASLFFGAPLIARFFERPELIPLVRVMSFIIIINALSLTQHAKLTKKVDFKTLTKVSVFSHIASGVIGIAMAFAGCGVWALVAQQLSSRGFSTVLLWIYNKWVPKLIFSKKSFKELFGFSWKLLTASIIDTLFRQMYQTVIGKCYSPATLGQYTRAQQYANMGSSTFGMVVKNVSFPVLSSIQNDTRRMKDAYRQIIKISMFASFVMMFMLAACSKSLILVLIGEKWLPCVPMLQILCFEMVLYPLHLININMIIVQGRSNVQLILQIVKTCLAIVPLMLGIYVDIYWMLWGSVIVGIVNFFLNSFFSGKSLGYSSWMQIRDIAPSFGIAIAVALPMYLLSFIPWNEFVLLPLQLVIGSTIGFAICEKTKPNEYVEVKNIIVKAINKTRKK